MSKEFMMGGIRCPVCERGIITHSNEDVILYVFDETEHVDAALPVKCPYCGHKLRLKFDLTNIYWDHNGNGCKGTDKVSCVDSD